MSTDDVERWEVGLSFFFGSLIGLHAFEMGDREAEREGSISVFCSVVFEWHLEEII